MFARCLATDWIDQPAHARRAELNGIPAHRAGLLDGPALRALLERRDQIHAELDQAIARHQHLPAQIRHARTAQAAAERAIVELHECYQRGPASHQRLRPTPPPSPSRPELDAARRDLADLPHGLIEAQHLLKAADATLTDLQLADRHVTAVLVRRNDIEAELEEIDQQLGDDVRIRTRVTRLEQPDHIIGVLGPRPSRDAVEWDEVAGRLAQHHAAHETPDKIGPAPAHRDYSICTDVHHAIATRLEDYRCLELRGGPDIDGPTIDL